MTTYTDDSTFRERHALVLFVAASIVLAVLAVLARVSFSLGSQLQAAFR